MKALKNFLKTFLKTSFCILLITVAVSFGYYFFLTKDLKLNTSAIEQIKTTSNLKIFDANGEEIKQNKKDYIKLSKLSSDTKNVFISAEDKRFYKHSGIDFIRIGGAIKSNLKSMSFKEGASTISQQLIKNTQLTNEKTIKRKLKEFKLTRYLEKKYSKNEILEMYLNNIYFGNGCYGIESASKHYFNKSASKLTLAESALLASTINAPSLYNIETNYEKTNKRKNSILNQMNKNKIIDNKKLKNAKEEQISLNLTQLSQNSKIYKDIFNEAEKILSSKKIDINNQNIKIFTSYNSNIANTISKKINDNISCLNEVEKYGIIILNNKTNLIEFTSFKNCDINSKIEIGSTIKPILIYAPAIEKKLITKDTLILDDEINISGYKPNNADKTYHGMITVEEALKNSYNIPAVKILNEIGVNNAIDFAKNFNLKFNNEDKNLSIALGSISNAPTLKELTDAYKTFANNGEFSSSSLISKIEYNGKTIYEKNNQNKTIMKNETANEITKMLIETAKTGTAKRLKDFDFDIASKTGTVGKTNSSNNTCALNICYTTEHTIGIFLSGSNMQSSINGSTHPTILSKEILSILYKNHKPENFNFKIEKPINKNNKNELEILNKKNSKPIIIFNINNYKNLKIIRKEKEQETEIFSCSYNNKNNIFEDITAESGHIYTYFIKYCDFLDFKKQSNSITLKAF